MAIVKQSLNLQQFNSYYFYLLVSLTIFFKDYHIYFFEQKINQNYKCTIYFSDTCLLPTPTEDNYRVVIVQATGEEHDDFEVILFYRYLIVVSCFKSVLVHLSENSFNFNLTN